MVTLYCFMSDLVKLWENGTRKGAFTSLWGICTLQHHCFMAKLDTIIKMHILDI